jgi:N-acylneuraminate cytidylyltransferase
LSYPAIVPARGGSKGIPGKNLRKIGGKSLIAHSITAAKNAEHVGAIYVSSDSSEILKEANDYGAQTIQRPSNISGDEATSESALLHALNTLSSGEDDLPERFVFLQCTSPLTQPSDIDSAIKKAENTNADSLLSVVKTQEFIWKEEKNNNIVPINHKAELREPRQSLEPQYQENGALYVLKTDEFLTQKERFFGKIVSYKMDDYHAIDIDKPLDLEIVRKIFSLVNKTKRKEELPDEIKALVLDFDGVFTDNKVSLNEDGKEFVKCDRRDGHGISLLKNENISINCISREANEVVQHRCNKLGIDLFQNINDKLSKLKKWAKNNNIDKSQLVFVGNDINDLECVEWAGCGVAVNDSHEKLKTHSNIVLNRRGGDGAIREMTDLILSKLLEGDHVGYFS